MIELVDFSRTANADWHALIASLKANGKHGVVRYCVNDKSPGGRGISGAEYQAYVNEGIEVGLYWEGTTSWMLGGDAAGVAAAQNAQWNIVNAGMPPDMPVYFAHDIDPEPRHFSVIDACLRGVASVIGWERVGVYGGWLLMDYMAQGGTVKFLAQTSAWEYNRGLHPKATIYQYAYNQYFAGTNCDLVRAMPAEWGQASSFVDVVPEVQPDPPTEPSALPEGMTPQLVKRLFGSALDPNGEVFGYNQNRAACKVWLREAKKSIPAAKPWTSGRWPQLVEIILRGDGRWLYQWSDGSSYQGSLPKEQTA